MLTSEDGLEGLMVNQRARSVLIDVREEKQRREDEKHDARRWQIKSMIIGYLFGFVFGVGLMIVREVLLPANANPLISPAENPANNHVGENSLNISQTFFITSPALRAVGCYCQNQLLVVS